MQNLYLLKILVWKQPWRKSKQWHKKYEKCQFCTQRRPKFNHHIKFRKYIMNSDVALKNFLTKHLCWSLFLIKIQAYSPANLLKRHSNTGVLLIVIAKFLRTALLRNICERFLLRVLPFMLVWTFFCRNKQHNKLLRKWRRRSSHWRCSVRKGALRNFAKFTGRHLCQSLFFNKVTGLSLQPY